MLTSITGAFLELVNESFRSTAFTQKITNVNWYEDVSMVTLRRDSSMLTEEECEKLLVEKFARENRVKKDNLSKT